MINGIKLRPARQEDFVMALDLYLTTMQPYTAELMSWDDVKQRESFTLQWKPEASEVIVYKGRTVGWFEAHTTATGTLLQQFFIAPECQGKGIGTQVLEHLQERWSKAGMPVFLTVLKDNPARRLYERFGFVVVGARSGHTQKDWDEVGDSPEWTKKDFATAMTLAEALPRFRCFDL